VRHDGGEVAEMAKFRAGTSWITKSMSEAKNTALGSRARFGYSRRVNPLNMKTITITTNLPAAVTQYFAAANRFDAAHAAACFTADATVHDENHDYVGHDAIRGWVAETSRKYQPMFTLMRTSVRDDEVSLSVAVAGQFPGSPVTLDYELRLRGGKISTLTIE
jgi:hypothetical protein